MSETTTNPMPPSDRYMTRNGVVEELLERFEADLANGADYCIGEDLVRKLFEAYRKNTPYGALLDTTEEDWE